MGFSCEPEKVYPRGIRCSDVPMMATYESIKKDLRKAKDKKRLENDYLKAARTLPRTKKNMAEEEAMKKDYAGLVKKIDQYEGWLQYCSLR